MGSFSLASPVNWVVGWPIPTCAKRTFRKPSALPSDTEDVINIVLTIAGTQFAVIFVEQTSGDFFKISFRSRCALDCSQIAEQFAGGGHRAAAGASIPGSLDEVRERVLGVVREAMCEAT